VNPGYVLARTVKRGIEEHRARHGAAPEVVLLQNHGLVVAGDDPQEIVRRHEEIASRVRERLRREPDLGEADVDPRAHSQLRADIAAAYREARAAETSGTETSGTEAPVGTAFRTNAEIARLVSDRATFEQVAGPFSPDHIVYAGPRPPLVARHTDPDAQRREIKEVFASHRREFSILPRALAVEGVGAFGVGPTEGAAEKAVTLFEDAVKVAAYAESFGGPRFMEEDQVDFIMSWEVEAYRAKISGGA
jgi:rhamnose utilization protein RhaD (predicted bifunctional aldolase and dehydrogenase)